MAVSFAADIRPLFTKLDIDHMRSSLDLSDYEDVKANADLILQRLQAIGGAVMPPPQSKGGNGPWPAERIALFERWVTEGCLP